MGQRSVQNLLQAIQDSRVIAFDRWIYALGIDQVGRTTAKRLAEHYSRMDDLMNASIDDLVQIKDIGLTTAQAIVRYFEIVNHQRQIEAMQAAGVMLESPKHHPTGQLRGVTLVLTGQFGETSRAIWQTRLENAGATIATSVSQQVDLVIVGDRPGSKAKKALEKGVPILKASQLMDHGIDAILTCLNPNAS